MAPTKYSWDKAKDLLSDSDKTRLVVWALVHHDQCKSDWASVAAEMGAASGNSAAVMHNGLLKKLRDKGAVYNEGEGPSTASPSKNTNTPSKSKATPASGKKRKTPAKKNDAAQDDDQEETPTKKARKPRAKKEDTPLSLKSEPNDDDSVVNSTEATTVIAGSGDLVEGQPYDGVEGGEMQFFV